MMNTLRLRIFHHCIDCHRIKYGFIFLQLLFPLTLFLFMPSTAEGISISQERKLAQEFMTSIRQQGKLIDDPIALELVFQVGQAMVAQLPAQPFPYSFYIVDDPQFNAFAGPGANIFVNRGLITSLDNVHELAGILGHEVAHAACRHISEMVDQSKMLNIGTMAGLLAGILVGATSGEGGTDLGQAVAIGSMAAGQTLSLSYSREHEAEADQKGLSFIQASHFDPEGLLTGLEKIRNRDYYGTEGIPAYMKTHPGTTERIVNIQAWLDRQKEINQKKNRLNASESHITDKMASDDGRDRQRDSKNKSAPNPSFQPLPVDPLRFKMVQARLLGLYGNEDEVENHFAAVLTATPENYAAHYGMALIMERKNRLDDALEHLRHALAAKAFDPLILVETGRMHLLSGNPEKAMEVTQGLERMPTVGLDATFILAEARLMLGMPQRALEGFETVIDRAPTRFPKAYYHMARINGEAGEKMPLESQKRQEASALSHYYLGLYYYYEKNMKNARFHLEKSLETLSDNEKSKRANDILSAIDPKKKSNPTPGRSAKSSW